MFSEDLSFSTDFTELNDSLAAQIAKEASDVTGINSTLDTHGGRLNTLESSLELTSQSLSEQIIKEAGDLATTNTHLGDLSTRITTLDAKEANDVIKLQLMHLY